MDDLERAYLVALEQAERARKAHPEWEVEVVKLKDEIKFNIKARKEPKEK